MNKKYIDFVPVKSQPKKATKKPSAEVAAVRPKMERKPVAKPEPVVKRHEVVAPKAKFVNTETVAKRPLSGSAKNVYTKRTVTTEPPKESIKPVKIIDKPKKGSKVGTIVAIIITIILGATAGTVAFLLLPK